MSLYRFHGASAMRFSKSLDLRVNWSYEWKTNIDFQAKLAELRDTDRGWVDYATTFYWYQQHVGYDHAPMQPLAERAALLLHPNLKDENR